MVSLKGKISRLAQNLNLDSKLSQNFLVDERAINEIINLLPPSSAVIEIGAGSGQITKKLLKNHHQVIAIEIDKKFKPFLEKLRQKYPKKLKIIYADALKIDWKKLTNKQKFWLTGNLPYHTIEPLIGKFIFIQFGGAVFLVGAKFAFETQLNEKSLNHFGKQILLVQSFFNPQIITKIPKTAFWPQPKTNSAILKLLPKTKNDYLKNPTLKILKDLFLTTSRNPLLKNSLREALIRQNFAKTKNEARKIIEDLKLSPDLLEKPFEQLNNSQLKSLYFSLSSLSKRF